MSLKVVRDQRLRTTNYHVCKEIDVVTGNYLYQLALSGVWSAVNSSAPSCVIAKNSALMSSASTQ